MGWQSPPSLRRTLSIHQNVQPRYSLDSQDSSNPILMLNACVLVPLNGVNHSCLLFLSLTPLFSSVLIELSVCLLFFGLSFMQNILNLMNINEFGVWVRAPNSCFCHRAKILPIAAKTIVLK